MAAGPIGPTWEAGSWGDDCWDVDSWGDSPDGGGGGTPVDQSDRRRRRIPRIRIRRG